MGAAALAAGMARGAAAGVAAAGLLAAGTGAAMAGFSGAGASEALAGTCSPSQASLSVWRVAASAVCQAPGANPCRA